MRPRRVLLLVASMEGGGSERQTLLLLQHLSRDRFAPELMVLRRGGTFFDRIPGDVPVHCLADRMSPPRINWPGRIHNAQVAALRHLLVEREIDLIYDRTFLMTLIAAPAAAAANVPRVSTIVSPPSRMVPLIAGRFLTLKRKRLARAYAAAARVIAVSRPVAQDARRYYGLASRQVRTIPNPVDAADLDAQVAELPPPQRDSRFTLACVGRMSQEKGQACLIHAMDRLRDLYPDFPLPRVWMVGDGPLRGELEAATRRYGLAASIDFVGAVATPATWISAADAVCVPSRFEGFPNVMLEAMALGTPVIASDIDVVRSLGRMALTSEDRGRDYVSRFRINDPVDLARKIRRLRMNSTGTLSRIASARNLARRGHAVERVVPAVEAIMLAAMNENPAGKRDARRF